MNELPLNSQTPLLTMMNQGVGELLRPVNPNVRASRWRGRRVVDREYCNMVTNKTRQEYTSGSPSPLSSNESPKSEAPPPVTMSQYSPPNRAPWAMNRYSPPNLASPNGLAAEVWNNRVSRRRQKSPEPSQPVEGILSRLQGDNK